MGYVGPYPITSPNRAKTMCCTCTYVLIRPNDFHQIHLPPVYFRVMEPNFHEWKKIHFQMYEKNRENKGEESIIHGDQILSF